MTTLINYLPLTEPVSKRLHASMGAATLFLRHGIAAVRMTDVAQYCGVGVASLYRRFGTKTNLAIAAGAIMWERFNACVGTLFTEGDFTSANGARQLLRLFERYCDEYQQHPDFVRFLDEFDHLVVQEQVPKEDLVKYGEAVDSFYPVFEGAYRDGLADGSIAHEVDFPVFYRTVAHATMGIAQRIVRGDIIPSDDFAHGEDELDCIVEMVRCTLGITDERSERVTSGDIQG